MAKMVPVNLFEFARDINTEVVITWRPYSVYEFNCGLKNLRLENEFETIYRRGDTISMATKRLVEAIKGSTLINRDEKSKFKVPRNLSMPKTMRSLENIQPTLTFLKDKNK